MQAYKLQNDAERRRGTMAKGNKNKKSNII